jgi:glutamyl-tRNA reductase
MVVGEPQILGQLKEAYQNATTQKASGVILNRLLHRTFFVAKRVRSETGIGDSAVSISYAAVELARKIFGSLEKKAVLLIGAGEMAELAVEHLIRNRVGDILVANRTFERGVDLAERFNGKAVKMEEIPDTLKHVDIIISSTGAQDFIITRDQIKSIMRTRRNRPLFFIDIAVPRDIDPDINRLNNSYVYDIDDLKGVIDENIEERKKEAVKGERIIDEAVIRFRQWYENLDIVPTIVDLRKKLDTIARSEVEKTVQPLKHLSEEDIQAIYRMTDAIVNKVLHYPTQYLKNSNRHGNRSVHLDIARRLFKLDD